MRKFLLAAICCLIFHVPRAKSQASPAIEWESCSPQGSCKAIIQVSDTRFASAAIGYDCEIPAVINLQLNESTGNVVWQKSYSFGPDNSDYVYSLSNAGNNGFIMSAFENHASISAYHVVIRTNSSGDTLWTKKFNIGINSSPVSSKIIPTTDGGYCLAAATYTADLWDVQVIKLNSNGVTTWTKTFGGSGDDYGKDIIQTADGGYMVAATTSSGDMDVSGNHGGNDIWVFKIDGNGNLQWQHCYGGSGSDEAKSMVKTSGNKFAVLGISTSTDGQVLNHHGSDAFYDNWLIKINDSGTLLWNNSYGGSSFEFGNQLVTNSDGSLIMAGSSYSDDGDIFDHHGSTDYDDIWTICTDSMGVILWSKSNGGSDYDNGYAIARLTYTQYVVGGNSLSTDGDLTNPCVTDDCYPISGKWMVKLANACQPANAVYDYDVDDNEVSFTNESENATQYLWDFGDGTTSSEANPTHVYPSIMAAYDVCMVATGPCGQDTSCKTIFVGKNPVTALFTYFSSGLTVVFTNLSSANAITFSWKFGDGATSTTKNPFHTYATNGVYNVCLIATDALGDADTLCQDVYVCDAFSSGFSYTSTGLTTNFTDLSNDASEWTWYFGDGNTSVAQNPTHVFASNGIYDVCLISSNVCGVYDTTCQTITVCQPIVPDFTLEDNYLSVQFTDLTATATSWLWVFDDGNFSTLQNPVHNYGAPGTYESVCLIATDLCNQSGTTCQSVTVCNPITAAYNFTANNLVVSFTDQTGAAAIHWSWNFGDGGTSSQKNPSHTYAGNGTYNVCLVAKDTCGNADTSCQMITVCKPLVANYTYTSDYLSVSFLDLTPNSSGWVWYFGDDSTSFTQNPEHTYNSPGTYNVCLVASDICGHSSNVCHNITVCSPINAAFSSSAFYLTASFTNQTGTAVQWHWNFGDGGTATSPNPSHTYSANGTYNVCLIATDVCGYSDTLCQSITVCQPLNAEYNYSASYLTVSFSDLTPNAATWTWYFDDDSTSNDQNPVHTYAASGNYEVCLVATDVCNNSNMECKTITICSPVNASFTTSTFYLTASFTDQTGTATQWLWDFGDGGASTSQNPSHSYSSSGTYTVCLTATDICGQTSTTCKPVTVCVPVAADFSYTASFLTAHFTDQTATAVQWHWDFGDGISSTNANPTHIYGSNGNYTVCLIATDICGDADTTCETITVCSPLNPAFSFSEDDLTVSFTDLSNSAVQWFWNFGDGGISTSQNPSHTYADFGTYEVCLIAFNLCASDTFCQSVTLQCPPFDAVFDFETSDYTASFSDQSTNAISWHWDFGDGTTSTQIDPVHVYGASGDYLVCLIASDGCSSDTTCQTVSIVLSSTAALADDVFSLDVYPNPLLSLAMIDFTLESSMQVRFDLYDVHGKNVLPIADKSFTSGKHAISMNCESLASGIYFLRMISKGGISSKKVIVQ